MSNNTQRKKRSSGIKVSAANYQATSERPFNRLLQDRDDREERVTTRKQKPRTMSSLKPANVPEKRQKRKASSSAPSGTQQIMSLLKDFSARLKRDDIERERLWKKMDLIQQAIDQEKSRGNMPSERMEKWRDVMEDNQRALYSQIEKTKSMQGEMDKRIESVETSSGSMAIRFDDVLSQQKRLSYRLDGAVEDKTRLLKKMANLEDALTQTQDTLKAKSLTLLSGQARSNDDYGMDVKRDNDPLFVQTRIKDNAKVKAPRNASTSERDYSHPEKRAGNSNLGYYAVAASVVAVLAVSGVLMTNKNATVLDAPISIKDKIENISSLEQIDMASIASEMNAIEPGMVDNNVNRVVEPQSGLATINDVFFSSPVNEGNVLTSITHNEKMAVQTLINNVDTGDLKKLIGVDNALTGAIKEVEAEALNGNGAAQHDLAAIYTAGHGGVTRDYKKAAMWFEQSSYNGVGNARYNLGVLYHQGLGVTKDEKYAIELYKAAAHVNHPEAQYNLGIAYIEGIGVPQDVARATHYFERAAVNDVMEASYNLGLIYENGLLGKAQPDEALFWYKVASSKGSPEGRQALSSLSKKLELSSSDLDILISQMSVLKPNVTMGLGRRVSDENSSVATPVSSEPVSTKIVYSEPTPLYPEDDFSRVNAGSDTVIVAQIQEQLIDLGLYPGPADGIVGPVTTDAVISYQKKNGLQTDGGASEDLLVHMLAREFELNTYPSSGLFEDVGSQE